MPTVDQGHTTHWHCTEHAPLGDCCWCAGRTCKNPDALHDFVTNINKPENRAIVEKAIEMLNEEQRKVMEYGWTCRFHPTDSFHEVGCPHQDWTKEDLQGALEAKKKGEKDFTALISAAEERVRGELKKEIEKMKKEITDDYNKNMRGMSRDGKLEMNAELNGSIITLNDVLALLTEKK